MKLVWGTTAAMFWANAALAEVCDKVRPNWHPGDSVAFYDPYLLAYHPMGIAVAILMIAAIWVRNCTMSVILVSVAILVVLRQLWFADGVAMSARAEGCIAQPYLMTCFILAVGVAIIAFCRVKGN